MIELAKPAVQRERAKAAQAAARTQKKRSDKMAVSESDNVTDRIYLAGRVKRYATWPTLHSQSVGEHTWAVMVIYEELWGFANTTVFRYILHHDSAELVVGDPPYPVKLRSPKLREGYAELEVEAEERLGVSVARPSDRERAQVKIADLLEMTMFGMTEVEMGNRLAAAVVLRTGRTALAWARDNLGKEAVEVVVHWLKVAWQAHMRRLSAVHPSGGYTFSAFTEEV